MGKFPNTTANAKRGRAGANPIVTKMDWGKEKAAFLASEYKHCSEFFRAKHGIELTRYMQKKTSGWTQEKQDLSQRVALVNERRVIQERATVIARQWREAVEKASEARICALTELSERVINQNKPRKMLICKPVKDIDGSILNFDIQEVEGLYPFLASDELIKITEHIKNELSGDDNYRDTEGDTLQQFLDKIKNADQQMK